MVPVSDTLHLNSNLASHQPLCEPFPFPGDIPNLGIKPRYLTLQEDSLPSKPPGKPKNTGVGSLFLL